VAAGWRRWLLAVLAGLAVGLLSGGGTGLVAAVVVTVGGERLLRRATPDEQAEARAALVHDLPVACDLIGVCLSAGVPVGGALAAVGEALPPPLGAQLRTVAALYRLGAEPRRAWADVPGELAALGRLLVRAGESGSAVVPALRALAADTRTAARTATETAVQKAAVWVLAPLGTCFLPAFVCLGVAPLVLGIAGDVFG
jgi:Flp pilus assembly protein TadB